MEKRIKLSGLDCVSCSLAIEHTLDRLPGVRDCEVDDKESTLTVDYDESQIDVARVLDAIRDAGFDAELA